MPGENWFYVREHSSTPQGRLLKCFLTLKWIRKWTERGRGKNLANYLEGLIEKHNEMEKKQWNSSELFVTAKAKIPWGYYAGFARESNRGLFGKTPLFLWRVLERNTTRMIRNMRNVIVLGIGAIFVTWKED